jgi:hypothetical protein
MAKTALQSAEKERPSKAKGNLKSLGGSSSDAFNNTIAHQVLDTLRMPPAADDETQSRIAKSLAAVLTGIGPRNEAEGMLVAQMVATHNASMECFRRAMLEGQTVEGREQNLRFADRLARTYTMQLDALKRYRRQADQTVRIERVVVQEGGQAIVGNVTRGGGGGGRNDDQAHA